MTHVIRQLTVQVDLEGTEAEGLSLNSVLPSLCQEAILPAIEGVLDRHSPADVHVQIDRLDVDAGILTPGSLEKDLTDDMTQAIERALLEQPLLRRLAAGGRAGPPEGGSAGSREDFSSKTPGQNTIDAFTYFLLHGRLPWAFRLQWGETLEQDVHQHLREGYTHSHVVSGLQAALTFPDARRRLVKQFSKKFLGDVVLAIAPDIAAAVQSVSSQLASGDAGIESSSVLDAMWDAALAEISAGKHTVTESRLAAIVLSGPESLHQSVAARLHHVAKIDGTDAGKTNRIAMEDMPDGGQWRTKGHRDSSSQLNEPAANSAVSSIEAIFIDNAGLVLLHPFLPMFFEALGVARDGKLQQTDRALGLLYFLATGREDAPEHELVLPKILCGLDPERPIEACRSLSAGEKEEAAALLEAVIRHWEVLRNTSPDGLRGSFLLRSGKLSHREDGEWVLRAESKSFDLLLDQLPWGFSMVQFPWMQSLLRVEWGNV